MHMALSSSRHSWAPPSPPPPSGPLPGPLAEWGRRIPAFLIDLAVLLPGMLVGVMLWFAEFHRVVELAGEVGTAPTPRIGLLLASMLAPFVLAIANRGVAQGLTGKSLGKHMMRVKVVRVADGAAPGLGWGLLRMLLESATGWIDVVCALVTDRRQRLGDLAAKTVVIDTRTAARRS